MLVNGYHYPFTEASKSSIWLHPLKGSNAKSDFNTPFEPARTKTPIHAIQGGLF